ncbi:PLP-dependent aminotransferase family protein [Mucilaginibacter gynuensis]|uniref:PLP-dependent aminotransferase family protein n=1 Tax=Mucilaginibacter gynuensis TaxID=1302236 RepID=A0ABP8G1I2_9SPHI
MEHNRVQQHDEFLYNQLAEKLERNITDGVLKTGDKLLSVRALSKEQGISLSTAFKAYTQLEIRGLIEARPKSGYYVRFYNQRHRAVPQASIYKKEPENVSVDEMLAMTYKNIRTEGVIKLTNATPALELLPESKLNKTMAEAIRRSPHSCINYDDVQGNIELRKHIARNAFSWGGSISADDVVTTQGCMEAMVFCLKAVAEPGDTIAIESPTYFGIFNTMKSHGLKVLEIPTDPETGISLEYLADAIEKVNIKACLFVTNFTNPLGCTMPDEKKKQLVELLAEKEIPLIEDDIYGELYFGKTRPRTCKSYDKKGLVLLCSSVSKTLAPGYRVGWCIPGRFTDKVINSKLIHTVAAATPTQAAVALFFETGRFDLHMRNLRKALHTQCLRYIQAVTEHFPDDTKVSQPKGGYVLWIELHKNINAFEVFKAALKYNIIFYPGHVFSTDARFTHCIRISFGSPFTKEIDHSLKIVGTLVKSLYKAQLNIGS